MAVLRVFLTAWVTTVVVSAAGASSSSPDIAPEGAVLFLDSSGGFVFPDRTYKLSPGSSKSTSKTPKVPLNAPKIIPQLYTSTIHNSRYIPELSRLQLQIFKSNPQLIISTHTLKYPAYISIPSFNKLSIASSHTSVSAIQTSMPLISLATPYIYRFTPQASIPNQSTYHLLTSTPHATTSTSPTYTSTHHTSTATPQSCSSTPQTFSASRPSSTSTLQTSTQTLIPTLHTSISTSRLSTSTYRTSTSTPLASTLMLETTLPNLLNLTITPLILSFRMQNFTFIPQNTTFTSQNITVTPQNFTFLPQNTTFTPQNFTILPQNTTFTPQNLKLFPQSITFSPQNLTFLPQNFTFNPQNSAFTTQNVTFKTQTSTPIRQNSSATNTTIKSFTSHTSLYNHQTSTYLVSSSTSQTFASTPHISTVIIPTSTHHHNLISTPPTHNLFSPPSTRSHRSLALTQGSDIPYVRRPARNQVIEISENANTASSSVLSKSSVNGMPIVEYLGNNGNGNGNQSAVLTWDMYQGKKTLVYKLSPGPVFRGIRIKHKHTDDSGSGTFNSALLNEKVPIESRSSGNHEDASNDIFTNQEYSKQDISATHKRNHIREASGNWGVRYMRPPQPFSTMHNPYLPRHKHGTNDKQRSGVYLNGWPSKYSTTDLLIQPFAYGVRATRGKFRSAWLSFLLLHFLGFLPELPGVPRHKDPDLVKPSFVNIPPTRPPRYKFLSPPPF